MCGILLAYGSKLIDQSRFNGARNTLIHRGPDAQHSVFLEDETLALGHTRLSIIDLASRSNQPMRDGNLWVIFNGEIYNYPVLRKALEAKGAEFKTNSDTEVLLHGYRHWGEGLCKHLSGMFAFAVWDESAKRIFLGRDHFGQKPLYYTVENNQLVVASEIKAIKAYSDVDFRLRKESIVDAMVQDFVAEPNTWYANIFALPAGCQMTVEMSSDGSLRKKLSTYWDFTPDPDPKPLSRNDALDLVDEALHESVSSHLLADVEIGSFLSGGMDSNCISMLANSLSDSSLRTFSIGFGEGDELPLAREGAQMFGTKHTESIVTEEDYQGFMGRALTLFDAPFGDTSIVPMTRVSQLASESMKVVLTGDGGDEIFGGYNYGQYLSPYLGSMRRQKSGLSGIRPKLQNMTGLGVWHLLGARHYARIAKEQLDSTRRISDRRLSLLGSEITSDLSGYDPSAAYVACQQRGLSVFRNAQWTGIKMALPSRMLAKVDRCAMAHSLETRAPFLSPRLAETILNLPLEITNPEQNWFKGLLSDWLEGKIPKSVLTAPKRGFDVPGDWSNRGRQSGDLSVEKLSYCADAGLVQPEAWQKLRSAPRVRWYFEQIELAIKLGMIRC